MKFCRCPGLLRTHLGELMRQEILIREFNSLIPPCKFPVPRNVILTVVEIDQTSVVRQKDRRLYFESHDPLRALRGCSLPSFAVKSFAFPASPQAIYSRRYFRRTTLGIRTGKVDFSRKILFTAVGLMAIAGPVVFGQVTATQNQTSPSPAPSPTLAAAQSTQTGSAQTPSFEVTSVRLSPPGGGLTSISDWGTPRFTATNATFQLLVEMAFNVSEDHIVGAPSWFESQAYSIDAKVEGDKGLTYEQTMPLLQQLLKDRFHLAVHREIKDFPAYALVVAKKGPKLQASKGTSGHGQMLPDQLLCPGCPLEALAGMLAGVIRSPVADKTEIKGKYDIKLDYAPNNATDSPLPSIYTALQEQLGLKLIRQKVPVEMLVIDHVDRVPTEN
jgi:uncharacterized protein (TIGR03435 family)